MDNYSIKSVTFGGFDKQDVIRYIEETAGKYMVSNCGRVKSLCGYTAKLLKPYEKENGYLLVKIKGHKIVTLNIEL